MADPSIVLASASASRAAVLSAAGVDFISEPADIDEGAVKLKLQRDGAPGLRVAEVLAFEKARAISARRPGQLVIGADQMLECDGVWYDKPTDMMGARKSLQILRGQTHQLLASVCVVRDGMVLWSHNEVARMTMRNFDDDFLTWYLEAVGCTVLQSVGAYRLEDIGAQLFERIDGDYFTILGLPLLPLLVYLRKEGALRQ